MLNKLNTIRSEPTTYYQLIVALVGLTLIAIGCIIILTPFFPAMLLAVIFTLATWPAFAWLRDRMKGRTALASYLMTMLLALCFVLPLFIIGTSIADNYDKIVSTVQTTLAGDPEQAAAKLRSVPLVGEHLEKLRHALLSDRERLGAWLQQYSGKTTEKLIALGASIGRGLFDITLGVLISWFLFRHGTSAANRTDALIQKFGGEHGPRLLGICKNTLTGVVYGLLGTALLQGALAAIGFWISGVPGASFLGLLTFFMSIVPMGPPLVWIPGVLWLLSNGDITSAVILGVWGAAVIGSIDNVMKPYFISRGSNLPLLLVLLGILGGVMAFGFIGVFIGPTLLAIAYSLIMEWSTVSRKAVFTETAASVTTPP